MSNRALQRQINELTRQLREANDNNALINNHLINLRDPLETFLQFYDTPPPDEMTHAVLVNTVLTKIINLREECYNANFRYETIMDIPISMKNEELNKINWTKIVTTQPNDCNKL